MEYTLTWLTLGWSTNASNIKLTCSTSSRTQTTACSQPVMSYFQPERSINIKHPQSNLTARSKQLSINQQANHIQPLKTLHFYTGEQALAQLSTNADHVPCRSLISRHSETKPARTSLSNGGGFVDLPQTGTVGIGMVHIGGQNLKDCAMKAFDEQRVRMPTLVTHHVAHATHNHHDHTNQTSNHARRDHHGFS